MFRRVRGQIRIALEPQEIELLQGLVREYLNLLDAEPAAGDPVRARLFPSASLDDPAVEAEYRDLSTSDLDAHKRAAARCVLASLEDLGAHGRAPLPDQEQQEAWLVLLTDLRLVLGVHLGVTEEALDSPPDPTDPAQWPLAVFGHLASLQDSLVVALQAGMSR